MFGRLAWLFRREMNVVSPIFLIRGGRINSGVTLAMSLNRWIGNRPSVCSRLQYGTRVAREGAAELSTIPVCQSKGMRMWQGARRSSLTHGWLGRPITFVCAPTGELSTDYAGLLFRTSVFSAECARRSHGIVWDRLRLYWEGFRDIVVPLPPLACSRRRSVYQGRGV